MKKKFVVLFLVAMMVVSMGTANAGPVKNVLEGLVRVAVTPAVVVKDVGTGVLGTVTLKKPGAIFGIPGEVRKTAFDAVEGSLRMVTAQEAIPIEDRGMVNEKITELGPVAEAIVDGAVYGTATGVIVHNANFTGAVHHVGKAVAVAFTSAIGASAISELTD